MKHPYAILPSMLSANFACLAVDLQAALDAGVSMIHVDVMDQHFVPNLTFGPLVLQSLKKHGLSCLFDVHLMVQPVDVLIDNFLPSYHFKVLQSVMMGPDFEWYYNDDVAYNDDGRYQFIN